jgi:hypothetical protein
MVQYCTLSVASREAMEKSSSLDGDVHESQHFEIPTNFAVTYQVEMQALLI